MSALPLDALFESLANGMWRGSLLVIAAAVLLRLVKNTTAAERYALWLAVLAVVALGPAAEALLSWARPTVPPVEVVWTATSTAETVLLAPNRSAGAGPQQRQAFAVSASPFLWLWFVVGLALALRLGRRCALAAKLKRNALPPGAELAAALEQWESRLAARRLGATRVTQQLCSPAAVGWLDPAVLLPSDSQRSADAQDLEMLWRHEQAHVARRDDWTQLAIECLFALAWFHPAAHWVRRQLEKERELACDETVVNSGVEAGRYAGALGRWAERAATNELPVGVMGLGRSRAVIIRRIEMLLSPSRILRRNGARWAFAGGFSAALGVFVLLVVSAPNVIRAQAVEQAIAVDVQVAMEPEVDLEIEVPMEVSAPQVSVEPLLMSQVAPPAPAVPAAPAVAPAPPVPPVAPVHVPAQSAKAIAEYTKRWREEVQPHVEAIQREAKRLQQEIRAKVGPQQEKMQALAKAMAEEHAKSIQPLARDMAKLGAQMAQASVLQREELAAKMDALAQRMEAKQPEFRRLEEEMFKIQIDMKPFEERMTALEKGLREKEKAFREAQGLWEKERAVRESPGLLDKEKALRDIER